MLENAILLQIIAWDAIQPSFPLYGQFTLGKKKFILHGNVKIKHIKKVIKIHNSLLILSMYLEYLSKFRLQQFLSGLVLISSQNMKNKNILRPKILFCMQRKNILLPNVKVNFYVSKSFTHNFEKKITKFHKELVSIET